MGRRRGNASKKGTRERAHKQERNGTGGAETYFSRWVLHLRSDLDFTLGEMAARLGLSLGVVWRWEVGTRLPGRKDREALRRLATLGRIDLPGLYSIILHSIVERTFVVSGVRLDPQTRRDALGVIGGLVNLVRSDSARPPAGRLSGESRGRKIHR